MRLIRLLTAAAALALLAGPVMAKPALRAPKPAAKPAAPVVPVAPVCDAKIAASTWSPIQAAGDLVETAKASGQFTIFLKAADLTNITLVLKQQKNLTVFAPTDVAFKALGADQLDLLLRSDHRAQLQKLLTYHIINAQVPSAEFRCSVRTAPTFAGVSVKLDGAETYKVNDSQMIQVDVTATNGVLHVIDKVLDPANPPK